MASAAPVSGELRITGAMRIGGDFADFVPLGGPGGDFNVEASSNGSFAAVIDPGASDDGDLLDLDQVNSPPGVPFSLPNFITFDLDPTLSFELQFVEPGAFSPCPAGQPMACSVGRVNLVRTGSSVLASFNVSGVVHSGANTNPFVGSFSNVFTNTTIAQLLQRLNTAGFI